MSILISYLFYSLYPLLHNSMFNPFPLLGVCIYKTAFLINLQYLPYLMWHKSTASKVLTLRLITNQGELDFIRIAQYGKISYSSLIHFQERQSGDWDFYNHEDVLCVHISIWQPFFSLTSEHYTSFFLIVVLGRGTLWHVHRFL
jgi:hypothetical protein